MKKDAIFFQWKKPEFTIYTFNNSHLNSFISISTCGEFQICGEFYISYPTFVKSTWVSIKWVDFSSFFQRCVKSKIDSNTIFGRYTEESNTVAT